MHYDDYLDVNPGIIATLAVDVIAAACGSEAEQAAEAAVAADALSEARALGDAKLSGSLSRATVNKRLNEFMHRTDQKAAAAAAKSRRDVTVSSKVKVELTAPFFPGDIAPIADGVQSFNSDSDVGRWEWQLKPNKPGDFQLPLRLTIYDSTGKEALNVAKILSVHVHVPMTSKYVASDTWRATCTALSSLQAIVASLAALAAGTAGFRAWAARRAKKRDVASVATTVADIGYM